MATHAASIVKPQRALGKGHVQVRATLGAADIGAAALVRLGQAGSARIRFSSNDDQMREAVLINTAGGLTGGDRFDWRLDLEAGARLRAITQACEKIYRSDGPAAEVDVAVRVAEGASLEWLPQETILFDGARLKRRFEIDLAPGARLLAVEAAILGRHAMGETDVDVALHDRWRVRRDGGLIFADDLKFEGIAANRDGPALFGGTRAIASVLLVAADAESRLEAIRPLLGPLGGASAFGGKLFCRLLENDGLGLRRRLTALISSLRDGRSAPRLWTV